jgi:hypothetical protein
MGGRPCLVREREGEPVPDETRRKWVKRLLGVSLFFSLAGFALLAWLVWYTARH